jgi:uncharacterized protein
MALLAVAAVSARWLAEAAARDGYGVVALDLFGDADTRRASAAWSAIGDAGSFELDGARVCGALEGLARRAGGQTLGWIPGGGFEGRPDVLEAGAHLLPLIGTQAEAVRRVRNPALFFDLLAKHGIEHPEVRTEAPADPQGWLLKDANGCGGWHIRHAAAASRDASHDYYQRSMQGMPMSATFIANGKEALVLGINELIVRPFDDHPHVYCGCIGPVEMPAELARRIGEAVRVLAAEFELAGWCSLDFIRDGDRFGVLELNPRPPASMALYAQRGLIDAHLRACLHGELPPPSAFVPSGPTGSEIVYARRPMTMDAADAQRLQHWPQAHDTPAAGARFAAGDPLCSLTASGESAGQVRALLAARRDALLEFLETSP